MSLAEYLLRDQPTTESTAAAMTWLERAAKDQEHAISEARQLEWDLAPLNQRHAMYAAGQAWTGDLRAFWQTARPAFEAHDSRISEAHLRPAPVFGDPSTEKNHAGPDSRNSRTIGLMR